jgi:hypothetical protein
MSDANSECAWCDDAGWVCEDHPDRPWGGTSSRIDACHCGGAGVPCKHCNDGDPPQKSGIVQVIADADGRSH